MNVSRTGELPKDRIMSSVFDNTAVGICITNKDRRFVLVNEAYCRTYGYHRDELIGQPFTLIVPEENREFASRLHDEFIEGKPEIPVEWTVQRKDGTLITVVTTAALLMDEDGNRYKITTVTDVTELRDAQRLVGRFGRIMERAYDEIYVFSAEDYRLLQVNQAAILNSGYSRQELLDMTPMDLNPDLMKVQLDRSVLPLRRGEKDIRIFETRQRRKDGSRYPVDVRLQLIGDEKPPVFVAIVQDSSERKKLHRIRQELRMAHDIQNNLMPLAPPEIPGYSIWGMTEPSREVGGDYFDFIETDQNALAICLGDVSGKGMPAALLMSNLQAIVRTEALAQRKPGDCLNIANRMLVRNTTPDRFVSFIYGILDAKRHEFVYANAGHMPPVIVRLNGELELPERGQLVLGFAEKDPYREQRISLDPGDLFVMYSDGITEAQSSRDSFFGEKRLNDVLIQNRDSDAETIACEVLRTVKAFQGSADQTDDQTLMVVKRELSQD